MHAEKITPPPAPTPPAEIVLRMTEDEALDLVALLGALGGSKNTPYFVQDTDRVLTARNALLDRQGIRKTTDKVWAALGSALRSS